MKMWYPNDMSMQAHISSPNCFPHGRNMFHPKERRNPIRIQSISNAMSVCRNCCSKRSAGNHLAYNISNHNNNIKQLLMKENSGKIHALSSSHQGNCAKARTHHNEKDTFCRSENTKKETFHIEVDSPGETFANDTFLKGEKTNSESFKKYTQPARESASNSQKKIVRTREILQAPPPVPQSARPQNRILTDLPKATSPKPSSKTVGLATFEGKTKKKFKDHSKDKYPLVTQITKCQIKVEMKKNVSPNDIQKVKECAESKLPTKPCQPQSDDKRNKTVETLESVKGQYIKKSRSKNAKREGRRRRKKNQRKSIQQNYKTEICRSHQMLGYCEYEDLCQFAHGVDQLLPRQFGLKYKTEQCKNYHKDGHCRFGSRCKFLHDEKRIKVSENVFWLVSQKENLIRVEVVDNDLRKAELDALTPTDVDGKATDSEVKETKQFAENLEEPGLCVSLKNKTNGTISSSSSSENKQPCEGISHDSSCYSTQSRADVSSAHASHSMYSSMNQHLMLPNSRNAGHVCSQKASINHSYPSKRKQKIVSSDPRYVNMRPPFVIKWQKSSENRIYYGDEPICMEINGNNMYYDQHTPEGGYICQDTQFIDPNQQSNNYESIQISGMGDLHETEVYEGGNELEQPVYPNTGIFLEPNSEQPVYSNPNIAPYRQNYQGNQIQQYPNGRAQNVNINQSNHYQVVLNERDDDQYATWYQDQVGPYFLHQNDVSKETW